LASREWRTGGRRLLSSGLWSCVCKSLLMLIFVACWHCAAHARAN
jgi:hypothetical protein